MCYSGRLIIDKNTGHGHQIILIPKTKIPFTNAQPLPALTQELMREDLTSVVRTEVCLLETFKRGRKLVKY